MHKDDETLTRANRNYLQKSTDRTHPTGRPADGRLRRCRANASAADRATRRPHEPPVDAGGMEHVPARGQSSAPFPLIEPLQTHRANRRTQREGRRPDGVLEHREPLHLGGREAGGRRGSVGGVVDRDGIKAAATAATEGASSYAQVEEDDGGDPSE